MSNFYKGYMERYWEGIFARKDSDSIDILQVDLGVPRWYATKLHRRLKKRTLLQVLKNKK